MKNLTEEEISKLLSNYEYNTSKIEIVDAPEIITNEESPTEAVKTKPNSSLVKAFDTLKQDEETIVEFNYNKKDYIK
mgnify:CR=1 FL=1